MPLKIFYLDDEPMLLEMFIDNFSGPGREIRTFTQPPVLIQAIKAEPADVLFVDYRLPNYTGDQVSHLIDPKIPKVLITADSQVALTYPYTAVFEKPYRPIPIEELIQRLEAAKR